MPRRKPTAAIVEYDKDTAELWRRKLIRSGFTGTGSFSSLSPSGGRAGVRGHFARKPPVDP
jgi:hypothetical protein